MTPAEDLRARAVAYARDVSPRTLSGSEAAGEVAALAVAAKALSGAVLRLARKVACTDAWRGQGHISASDWLAATCGISVPEAKAQLRTAKQIEELGATADALANGELGVDRTPLERQGDALWYWTTARSLSDGHLFRNYFTGLPTADHPPLTVLVLAPASWLFDGSSWVARLTVVVLGALVVALIGLAGRRLAGPVAGIAAAVTAALSPALWASDVLSMSETITALCLAAILWASAWFTDEPGWRRGLGLGALCGLAALARAEMGLLVPLLAWPLALTVRDVDLVGRLRLAATATVAAIAVVLPWTAFTSARFGEPVVVSTNDGLTLAGANCDLAYHGARTGGWLLIPCVSDAYRTVDDAKPSSPPPVPAGTDPGQPCFDEYQQRLPCSNPAVV